MSKSIVCQRFLSTIKVRLLSLKDTGTFSRCYLNQNLGKYLITCGSKSINVRNIAISANRFNMHPNNLLNSLKSNVGVGISKTQVTDLAQSVKKRVGVQRRKRSVDDEKSSKPGFWNVIAFASAEEYDLERIKYELTKKDLYQIVTDSKNALLAGGADVLHVEAKYKVSNEPRHIFFFREGSIVAWNVSDVECVSILDFIRKFEIKSYERRLVEAEKDSMLYTYNESSNRSFLQAGNVCLGSDSQRSTLDTYLDKYTFSNAMALSVKLGIWEAILERYIDAMEFITEDLKSGKRLRISRSEVLCKTGELIALRHSINLSSDLLDTPDFYWDHDELEALYLQSCNYFSISRRTKVMNEKLNHCMELVELLSTQLSDRHHVRLEWMIIVLIMVEVMFEIIHYMHY